MKISRYLRNFLLAAVVLAVPASSFAGIFISVGIAPPPLPVYEQPPIPGDGYLWTPGYWAWSPDYGYYWVPGTWVQPPQVGFLWTPGYWGWNSGAYIFNAGYWGPHIGFYGGVNYGFGYGGVGYEGGYWDHGHFAYNRSVNNINNVHITNVYNHTVVNNTTINRTSFNGGNGGIQARPSAQEQAAVRENHVQPTPVQMQHINQAQNNPQLRASVNGGKPAIAATARPGDFSHAIPARQAGGQVNTAVYKAAASNGGRLPANMKDPGGNSPEARPAAFNQPARTNAPNAAFNGNAQPRPSQNPAQNNAQRPGQSYNPQRPAQNAPYENASRPEPASRPYTNQPSRPASQPGYAQQQREPAYNQPQHQQQPQREPAYSQPQHEQQSRPEPSHAQQPRPQQHAPEHESAPHEEHPRR